MSVIGNPGGTLEGQKRAPDSSSNGAKSAPAPLKGSREVWSFIKTIIALIIAALLLRGTVVEAFKIPSSSMVPTLRIGDQILVSKLSYGLRLPFVTDMLFQFASPRRGDVVVFTRPDDPTTPNEDESSINIIKRVIGLPGDEVQVSGMQVYINGKALSEPYAVWDEGGKTPWGPEVIPAGHVLLLGDNRDNSKDSRLWTNPFLPMSRIKGRALVIYWSFDVDWLKRIGKLIGRGDQGRNAPAQNAAP